MRRLVNYSLLAGPLLMIIGISGAGAIQRTSHLPGREVNTSESSEVLGGCSNLVNTACDSPCAGGSEGTNGKTLGSYDLKDGGCVTNCRANLVDSNSCSG